MWEYYTTAITIQLVHTELDALGKQGWELVAVLPFDPLTHFAYFKRPVSSKQSVED